MKKNLVLVILVIAIVAIAAVGFSACSKKTSIGVQAGTVGEYFVKGDADWGYEGFKNLKAEPYSNGGLAVQAMKNGTVKAVVLDVAPATTLAKEIEGIKVINIPLTQEQYGFAIDKSIALRKDKSIDSLCLSNSKKKIGYTTSPLNTPFKYSEFK